METIENVRWSEPKNRDTEVKYIVLESTILDEEKHIEEVVLRGCEPINKVTGRVLIKLELGSTWSFDHQNHVSHFITHILYF